MYDTALTVMAFERLGHMDYAVLKGGYVKRAQENRPTGAPLPTVTESKYPVKMGADAFTTSL